MLGQEVQRRIGEDEVRRSFRRPVGDVLPDELGPGSARSRMRQHQLRGVDPGDLRLGEPPAQKLDGVAGPAAQIVDDMSLVERDAGEQVAGRERPLVLELHIEARIPVVLRLEGLGGAHGAKGYAALFS